MCRIGDGTKGVVWRIDFGARESLALKIYSRSIEAEREQSGYAAVGTRAIGLPAVVGAAAVGVDEGFPNGWTLMTLVDGPAFNTIFNELGPERQLEVYREVGALLARMHAVRCDGFGLVANSGRRLPDNQTFVTERLAAALNGFAARGGNNFLAHWMRAWFEERAGALAGCTEPVLCHGDLHAENIHVTGLDAGRLSISVLDLSECFAGDPAMDLCGTHQARFPYDDRIREALLEGYGEPPPRLEDVYDVYFLISELDLWDFFARGGSRRPLASIERRMARLTGAPRHRVWRSAARRRLTRG